MRHCLAVIALLLATPVLAQDMDSMTLANELGSVLAGEEFCGLDYDQEAIAAFVEAEVDADDMSFPGMLKTMTDGHMFQQSGMSASAKTANCTQIARLAKSYGFTK